MEPGRLSRNGQQVVNTNASAPVYPFYQPYNRWQAPGYFMGYGPVYKSWAPQNDFQSNVKSLLKSDNKRGDRNNETKRRIINQLQDISRSIDYSNQSQSIHKSPQMQPQRSYEGSINRSPQRGYEGSINRYPTMNPQQSYYADAIRDMQDSQDRLMQMLQSQPQEHQPAYEYHYPIIKDENADAITQQYKQIRERPSRFDEIVSNVHFNEMFLQQKDPSIEELQALQQQEKLEAMGIKTDAAQNGLIPNHNLTRRGRGLTRRLLKGKSKFRMVAYVVWFPFVLKNFVSKKRQRNKETALEDMTDGIRLYSEVGKSWLVKVIRAPLTSIVIDPELDLDIAGSGKVPRNFEAKLLKVKVRIHGILEGLWKAEVPRSVRLFLIRFIGEHNFIPAEYMSQYERVRLQFDQLGGLRDMNEQRKQMMIVTFFITRILVTDILLNPKASGISVNPNRRVLYNLKIIASILQHMVLLTFVDVGKTQEIAKADEHEILNRKPGQTYTQKNDDKISKHLFTVKEFEQFYKSTSNWTREMAKIMVQWASKCIEE